jgi:hypothetical protein
MRSVFGAENKPLCGMPFDITIKEESRHAIKN